MTHVEPEIVKTNSKTSRKTSKEKEELEKQIETLSVPGYSIHQEGVFTIVRRVNKTGRSRTFPARLARCVNKLSLSISRPLISIVFRLTYLSIFPSFYWCLCPSCRWLLQSDKWLPFLFRYAKESFLLAPWRMCMLLAYKLVQSQVPLARLWASTRMRYMVEQAIETGHIDKLKLSIFAMLAGFLSTGSRTVQLFL